jgi:hypothetical protein
MNRFSTVQWFVQALALAGIICFSAPGFADSDHPAPDDQVTADPTSSPDESTASTDELSTDTAEPTERTEESSGSTEDLSANTTESTEHAEEPSGSTEDLSADTTESTEHAEESSESTEDLSADTTESTASADSAPNDPNPSIILKGRVWRTKPGIVFLRTPIGLLSLSSKTALKDLLASQEISFWVHDAHLAVDIRKVKDGSLVHRYLSGPFKQSENEENKVLRWTPEGERPFDFGAHKRSLSAFQEGDPVTVEVNEADTVIGVHDLQFDLQIGQIPAEGSTAHLLLSGTVAKLKSNFIFLRTPVGVVNVNAKIGVKNAKIGQDMTLHIHDRNVVADLAATDKESSARRFVTGPLEFASPDRTSVRLWTPEGEQTYPTDSRKAALSGVREGSLITVELNGQGDVIEFRRLK